MKAWKLSAALAALLGVGAAQAAGPTWSTMGVEVLDKMGRHVSWLNPPPANLPSVADGLGGAKVVAPQTMGVGGATASVQAFRYLRASELARAGMRAAKMMGPLGIASLVVDGIRWAAEEFVWKKSGSGAPAANRWWQHDQGPIGTACKTAAEQCTWSGMRDAVLSYVSQSNGAARYDEVHKGECVLYQGDPANAASTVRYRCVIEGKIDSIVNGQTVTSTFTHQWEAAGAPSGSQNDPQTGDVLATDVDIETAIKNALAANPALAGQVLDELLKHVTPDAADWSPTETSGPASVTGPSTTSTTTGPNGTTTATTTITNAITYNGPTITITPTTTQTDGTTTTTTTGTGNTELSTCGLPNTPPCKMDETGTPTADATVNAGKAAIDAALDGRTGQLGELTNRDGFGWLPTLPSINASCSPIQVGDRFSLDVCPALEIGRAGFSFLWAALGLIYCWRRVGETVAGGV